MRRNIVTMVVLLLFSVNLLADKIKVDEKGGELGFRKFGQGKKTLLLVPGIGDLKENYNDFIEEMEGEATIFALDLRGLGESSVQFSSYGADETGKDIVFFINQMDLKNVTIVSNSMSAASAIYAATRLPERVDSIVLTGPFIKDTEIGFFLKMAIGAMFRGPWGPSVFQSFYEGLYPVNKPSDLEMHSNRIKENLKEDGRLAAVRSMFFARKPDCEKSIESLRTKVIIIMGDKDPDFEDPSKEAMELATLTKGSYTMFENSGHYPYKDDPKKLKSILLETWAKK